MDLLGKMINPQKRLKSKTGKKARKNIDIKN